MRSPECPDDAGLLAWLRDPLDVKRHVSLVAHVNACTCCQNRLEQLDHAEDRRTTASGDNLLEDLRRSPPADGLETEPECVRAGTFAETVGYSPSVPGHVSRQPDVTDVRALTHRGHYEILGVLGQGGMGVVYKARNLKMNRLVAIKVLPPLKPQDPDAAVRFEREMKAVARLMHPHVVAAYDADEADGKHFLVMEYVEGSDLRTLVKENGPLPVAKVVEYVAQAARALHYAHGQGIVHRDVKPANLMLDRSGIVKLLDLGLARIETLGEKQTDLTATGMLMGTVDFLAPEQAANTRDVDGRADVYSLGCSLYYLLTGGPLYDGDTIIQKLLAHREKRIPSLRDVCPACPASLEKVFVKMVAKRPDERYQTMADVIADLEQVFTSLESSTLLATDAFPKAALSKNQTGWRRFQGKRRTRGVAAAVLFLGLATVLLLTLVNRPRPDGPEENVGKNDSVPGLKTTPDGQEASVPLACGTRAGQEWGGNALKMKFCWCPAGKFTMGSPINEAGRAPYESPHVEVVLSQGFWMGKFEATQDEWEKLMGTKPSKFNGAGTLPVENVTWREATKFCALLTERERVRRSIPVGWEFRLPTDAQWEYACRAGTKTVYSFGPSTEGIGDYTWYTYNSNIETHEVGRRKPNPWGLHDMHGNVWEWCRDWFHPTLPGGTDPEVQHVGTGRVFRGGGWSAAAEFCRTAFRSGQVPDEATSRVGFRVAAVQVATPDAK